MQGSVCDSLKNINEDLNKYQSLGNLLSLNYLNRLMLHFYVSISLSFSKMS